MDNQDSKFWVDFTKKLAEKNSFNEVIMKIATHKKSKDSREALEWAVRGVWIELVLLFWVFEIKVVFFLVRIWEKISWKKCKTQGDHENYDIQKA